MNAVSEALVSLKSSMITDRMAGPSNIMVKITSGYSTTLAGVWPGLAPAYTNAAYLKQFNIRIENIFLQYYDHFICRFIPNSYGKSAMYIKCHGIIPTYVHYV
jgi:hypothetical protein